MCPTALVLASPSEGEDDDFVVICTNRAVLDVGLLSLHDLRADSLIRPIASRSVIQLLSNHCHFNNRDGTKGDIRNVKIDGITRNAGCFKTSRVKLPGLAQFLNQTSAVYSILLYTVASSIDYVIHRWHFG